MDVWKIDRDYFYKDLFDYYGLEYIQEAGFFYDTNTSDYNIDKSINALCTPINFLKKSLHKAKNPCILLLCGALCPVHDGHIHIMEQAKKAVEEKGYNVIGGYLSPGHDEYILSKVGDDAHIPAFHRIKIINDALKDIPWLSVDPWESMFCKVAVNFTDVIYRLQIYSQKHLGTDIPVFFVCGSDNAQFSLTFKLKGNCVVVGRPGSEEKYEKYSDLCKTRKNVIFYPGENNNSSTKVRKTFKVTFKEKDLNLRMNKNNFEDSFASYIKRYFYHTTIHDISEQRKAFKKFNTPVINLDSLMSCDNNLKISRQYDLFGINKIGYTNRAGSVPLYDQVCCIPSGEYFLFDDDIYTGNTMHFAKDFLEKNGSNIKILGFISLNISKDENTEILDCRDFIISNQNNGLCIKLPDNSTTRVPYIYPYVCPYIRASILDPLTFSIDIWKMNMESHSDGLCLLKDLPFLKVFEYIGFKPEDSIYDICKWHYEYLKELL